MIWRSSWAGCVSGRKAAPAATTVSNRSSCTLGTEAIPRLRLGIGAAPSEGAVDYVLGRFFEEEIPVVEKTIARAADAVKCAIDKGVLSAMNLFNKIPES